MHSLCEGQIGCLSINYLVRMFPGGSFVVHVCFMCWPSTKWCARQHPTTSHLLGRVAAWFPKFQLLFDACELSSLQEEPSLQSVVYCGVYAWSHHHEMKGSTSTHYQYPCKVSVPVSSDLELQLPPSLQ
jgi:hypothetical protein